MQSFDAQSPDPDSNDAHCEPERAIERLGNMRTLYANVVARFVDDSAGNFSRLRNAVQAGDFKGIHYTAHSLKGLAAMCGAVGVENVLCDLEAAGADSDGEQVQSLYERLEVAVAETRNRLTPYRQNASESA